MDASPGELLRQALRESGLTQGQLAQRIGLAHPAPICLILSGRRPLTPKMARRLGQALELDADALSELERTAALSFIKI